MLHMNSARMVALAAVMLWISACQPLSSTSLPPVTTEEPAALDVAPSSTSMTQPLLKTEMGDFVIASARLVDEANGVEAQSGQKILLVILTQPGQEKLDPGEFSLETFSSMIHDSDAEIYVVANDGTQAISTMGGWVEDEFAMGFVVPANAAPYTLHWTGNSPLVLNVE